MQAAIFVLTIIICGLEYTLSRCEKLRSEIKRERNMNTVEKNLEQYEREYDRAEREAEQERLAFIEDVMGGLREDSAEICWLAFAESEGAEGVIKDIAEHDLDRVITAEQLPIGQVIALANYALKINKIIRERVELYK